MYNGANLHKKFEGWKKRPEKIIYRFRLGYELSETMHLEVFKPVVVSEKDFIFWKGGVQSRDGGIFSELKAELDAELTGCWFNENGSFFTRYICESSWLSCRMGFRHFSIFFGTDG